MRYKFTTTSKNHMKHRGGTALAPLKLTVKHTSICTTDYRSLHSKDTSPFFLVPDKHIGLRSMNKFSLLILSATSALIAAPTAIAEDHFYGGFEFGLSHAPGSKLNRAADNLRLDVKKETSPVGGLYFGKKVGSRRFEIEYLLRRNNFKSVDVLRSGTSGLTGNLSADGVQKKDSLMVNGWQRLAGSDIDWSLLAGVGVGMTNVAISDLTTNGTRIANTSKWVPSVQVMAQVVKPFGQGLEAGIGYRYLHNFKEEFSSSAFDYKSFQHEIFARLSWRFGADAPKAAAPEPMPAPAQKPVAVQVAPKPTPAPVPAPKPVAPAPLPAPFIVYFDFDKDAITGTAAKTIADAAKAYHSFKAIEIVATGHADRAGSVRYNEVLSEKRVEAVKAALVAEGVPANKINNKHEGESNPSISTDDGVREHKNRRVEIKFIR